MIGGKGDEVSGRIPSLLSSFDCCGVLPIFPVLPVMTLGLFIVNRDSLGGVLRCDVGRGAGAPAERLLGFRAGLVCCRWCAVPPSPPFV